LGFGFWIPQYGDILDFVIITKLKLNMNLGRFNSIL
jgi:uncharacterized membrane protein